MKKEVKIATIALLLYGITSTSVFGALGGFTILGVIPTTGVVTRAEIAIVPSSFTWGNVTLDDPVIKTVRLDNTSNVTISNLTMFYTLPVDFNGTLTWDAEGKTLGVTESLFAEFNLTLTDAPEVPFSFNITIAEG